MAGKGGVLTHATDKGFMPSMADFELSAVRYYAIKGPIEASPDENNKTTIIAITEKRMKGDGIEGDFSSGPTVYQGAGDAQGDGKMAHELENEKPIIIATAIFPIGYLVGYLVRQRYGFCKAVQNGNIAALKRMAVI